MNSRLTACLTAWAARCAAVLQSGLTNSVFWLHQTTAEQCAVVITALLSKHDANCLFVSHVALEENCLLH